MPDDEIAASAAEAGTAAPASDNAAYVAGAIAATSEAAIAASSSAFAVGYAASDDFPTVFDAASAAVIASDFSPGIQVWRHVQGDASLIEAGKTTDLLSMPIWQSPPAWWEQEKPEFETWLKTKPFAGQGFDLWLRWYDDVAHGRKVFGIRNDKLRKDLELAFALGSRDGTFDKRFWEQTPAKINATLAEWVGEADGSIGAYEPSGEVEPQNQIVVTFAPNVAHQIDIENRALPQGVDLSAAAQERHAEVLSQVNALQGKLQAQPSANNNDGQVQEAVAAYATALSQRLLQMKVEVLAVRGDKLRRMLTGSADESRMTAPISDMAKDGLGDIVAAHNTMMALDPELERRDKVLLGPDYHPKPVDVQAVKILVEAAIKVNVATPAVGDVIDAAAAAVPAVPDAQSRTRRRFTEIALNVFKATIKFVWDNKGKVAAAGGGVLAAARYIEAHQDKLIAIFVEHPTMIGIIKWIADLSKNFPH